MRPSRRCAVRAAIGSALVIAIVLAGPPVAASASATSYVDVSVATVWASPSAPRSIDNPALGNPVDMNAWSRVLTTPARLGLVGRIVTQALFGEPLRVLARRGSWTRVAVVDQPTPLNQRGYPGWVPSDQVASSASFGRLLEGPIAVVNRPTVLLHYAARSLQLSFGTRLPVLASSGSELTVGTPDGQDAKVAATAMRAYSSATAIPAPSPQSIAMAARTFLGVRYLWGGTSAFGFDCSGLINLIYRAAGVVVPRDADAQARAGRTVRWTQLRPGDVLFYGHPEVDHSALYVGGGMMIEAPDSAGSVREVAVGRGDYAGARRYLR